MARMTETVFDEPIYLGSGMYLAAPTVLLCPTYGGSFRVFRVPCGASSEDMQHALRQSAGVVCTPPIPWDVRKAAGWSTWDGTGATDLRWVVVWLRWWLDPDKNRAVDRLAQVVCSRLNRAHQIRRYFTAREDAAEHARIDVYRKRRRVHQVVKEIRAFNREQKRNRQAS